MLGFNLQQFFFFALQYVQQFSPEDESTCRPEGLADWSCLNTCQMPRKFNYFCQFSVTKYLFPARDSLPEIDVPSVYLHSLLTRQYLIKVVWIFFYFDVIHIKSHFKIKSLHIWRMFSGCLQYMYMYWYCMYWYCIHTTFIMDHEGKNYQLNFVHWFPC